MNADRTGLDLQGCDGGQLVCLDMRAKGEAVLGRSGCGPSDVVLNATQVGPVRFILVGLLIMLLVIFRPQGFLGSRREVMIGD